MLIVKVETKINPQSFLWKTTFFFFSSFSSTSCCFVVSQCVFSLSLCSYVCFVCVCIFFRVVSTYIFVNIQFHKQKKHNNNSDIHCMYEYILYVYVVYAVYRRYDKAHTIGLYTSQSDSKWFNVGMIVVRDAFTLRIK